MKYLPPCVAVLLIIASAKTFAGTTPPIDSIIQKVLLTHQTAMAELSDLTLDIDSYERRLDGDGNVKETAKLVKKGHLKRVEGGKFLYCEDYNEYYINGERQDQKSLKKITKERLNRKKKSRSKDLSFDITTPLEPQFREIYDIVDQGLSEKEIEGYPCFLLSATVNDNNTAGKIMDTLANYLFYIDTLSYQIVKVDFEPARLISKLFFKFKLLKMSISFAPYDSALWLPSHFHIDGRAKAAFFVGVNFEGEEFFKNPVINSGLDDSLFKSGH